jgi:DNA-binding response OmpR family regulator
LNAVHPLPVIVVVEAEGAAEALGALAAGAVALVARPYRIVEIMPLLRQHLSPIPDRNTERIAFGGLQLDLAGMHAYAGGLPVSLTLREFALLHYLVERPNRVVPREQILREVWGDESAGNNNLTVHVKRIREKLAAAKAGDCVIGTVRGKGYRLELLDTTRPWGPGRTGGPQ